MHRDVKPANVLLADEDDGHLGAHPRLRPRPLRGRRDAHRRRRRAGHARVHRARAAARRARRGRPATSGRSACCCTRRSPAVIRSGARRSPRRPRRSRKGRRRFAPSGRTCPTRCSRRSTARSPSIRRSGRRRRSSRACCAVRAATATARRSRAPQQVERQVLAPVLAGVYAGVGASLLPFYPAHAAPRARASLAAALTFFAPRWGARLRARAADLPARQRRALARAPLRRCRARLVRPERPRARADAAARARPAARPARARARARRLREDEVRGPARALGAATAIVLAAVVHGVRAGPIGLGIPESRDPVAVRERARCRPHRTRSSTCSRPSPSPPPSSPGSCAEPSS